MNSKEEFVDAFQTNVVTLLEFLTKQGINGIDAYKLLAQQQIYFEIIDLREYVEE